MKKLDDPTKRRISLAFSKIAEEEFDDDPVQIISLSSPMRVRSPSQNNARGSTMYSSIPTQSSNDLNLSQKMSQVHLSVPNINPSSSSMKGSNENLRKPSMLSLKSLSMSLKLLRNRTQSDSLDMEMGTLETINETQQRKSIFQMDIFERNLRRFTVKSNEDDFQTYSDYMQQQQSSSKSSIPKMHFKNQKVHARRSSTSDIHESKQMKSMQNQSNAHSSSQSNVKHSHEVKRGGSHGHAHEKNKQDKTAEVLKEVRKRNMETSRRMSAVPRRTSTAY